MFFQVEEECDEADMMDQLVEDEQEQEMSKEWEEDGKRRGADRFATGSWGAAAKL